MYLYPTYFPQTLILNILKSYFEHFFPYFLFFIFDFLDFSWYNTHPIFQTVSKKKNPRTVDAQNQKKNNPFSKTLT